MKRRSMLQSLVAASSALAAPPSVSSGSTEKAAPKNSGVPIGPPVVAPGLSETPLIPVQSAEENASMQLRTFNPVQFATLSYLSELIVPSREDVPGAKEAEAASFLDFFIGQSPTKVAELYRAGIDHLHEESKQRYGKPFAELTVKEAEPLLSPLERDWQSKEPEEMLARFLQIARSDILKSTFNSRPYQEAVGQTRRSRTGSGLYWYPMGA